MPEASTSIETQSLADVSLAFRRDRTQQRGRFNAPSVDEVAMIFDTKNGEPSFDRDIQVYPRIGVQPIDINILSPNLDPMTYPLFSPMESPDGNRI